MKENQLLKKQFTEETKDPFHDNNTTMTPTVITDDGFDSVTSSLNNDDGTLSYVKCMPKKLHVIFFQKFIFRLLTSL